MNDERSVAWLDYILGSDAPGDKLLAEAYLALDWEYGEYSRWIMQHTAEITDEMLARIGELQTASQELTKRIYARAQELVAAGDEPADEVTAEAWHATRRKLATAIPGDQDEIYRT